LLCQAHLLISFCGIDRVGKQRVRLQRDVSMAS
jgi:hypothetical protein